MEKNRNDDRDIVLLRRMERAEAILAECIRELGGRMRSSASWPQGRIANLRGSEQAGEDAIRQVIVDRASMTVVSSGRTCSLSNTVQFKLMEFLAHRPNQHHPYERLLRSVWDGRRVSDDTIRSTVRHLRQRLRGVGMNDLARAIESAGRMYGLMLPPLT